MQDKKVWVIAEAGVNHGGDEAEACRLAEVAKAMGADAVKFQLFDPDRLAMPQAPLAAYQRERVKGLEDQRELLWSLTLSTHVFQRIADYCRELEIACFASPFDLENLNFLVRDLDVDRLKIASGEITHGPLLVAAGRSGKKILLSTGMSFLSEVEIALGALAFGMLGLRERPGRLEFQRAFASAEGRRLLRERVELMHCCSMYPAPVEATNLRALTTLRAAFGLPVGFSDHSESVLLPALAVALGATTIEKHLTLDRDAVGPDHRASLDPSAFAQMVRGVREAEAALGDGMKAPQVGEWELRAIARRGVYLDPSEGLIYRRPENGRDAMEGGE